MAQYGPKSVGHEAENFHGPELSDMAHFLILGHGMAHLATLPEWRVIADRLGTSWDQGGEELLNKINQEEETNPVIL